MKGLPEPSTLERAYFHQFQPETIQKINKQKIQK